MPRSVIAMGPAGIRKTVEILAAEIGKAQSGALEAGTQWGGDRMLLSFDGGAVRFVAGSTIYQQDHLAFLLAEFPAGGAPPSRASWLRSLSAYDLPLSLGLAAEVTQLWPGIASARGFLDLYSHFYLRHRPQIESAAQELRYVAEGLLALQHWPVFFEQVMDAMGPTARRILPNGLESADIGGFLGRLLMRAQEITLARIPECLSAPQPEECVQSPHYRRLIDKLERGAQSAAPLIEELRVASQSGPGAR